MAQAQAPRLCDFATGSENLLALNAVLRLLDEADPSTPEPANLPDVVALPDVVVLHGPPGIGKSHLALGVAHEWQARRASQCVVCLRGSEFVEQHNQATESRTLHAWRNSLRQARLAVLDDMGPLVNRPPSQVELLNWLDAMRDQMAPVVITSRIAPVDMSLLPGLQSRLQAGLVLGLVPPGPQARLTLLRRWALQDTTAHDTTAFNGNGHAAPHLGADTPARKPAARNLDVADQPVPVCTDRALRWLASHLPLNALELNAALAAVGGLADRARTRPGSPPGQSPRPRRPLGIQAVKTWLARREKRPEASLRRIAARSARHFSIPLTQLQGTSRRRAVVSARGVAIFLARQLTGNTLAQIGEFFGGRDHTTILHALRKTEELAHTDPDTHHAIRELSEDLACE